MALIDKLTAIGDAIRSKTGKSEAMTLDQMPAEIASIQGGGGDAIIKTVTGACPITQEDCAGGKLLDYKIYGADGGVGNKTKNLCSGVFNATTKFDEPIPAGTKFSVSAGTKGYDASNTSKRLRVRFFATDGTQIANMYPTLDESGNRIRFDGLSYSKDVDSYWLSVLDVGDYQIEIGEKHTEYEPYGYSVGIKVNDATSKIYIKEQLGTDDYIDFENRKVVIGGVKTMMELPELPLIDGSNTFDVETTVKPSSVGLSYVSKSGAYDAGYHAMRLAVDMSDLDYQFRSADIITNPGNWYAMNINFTDANGVEYTRITTYTQSSKVYIQYKPKDGPEFVAYNYADNVWANDAYRSIHISDGDMVTDMRTCLWLLDSGQFITDGGTYNG